MMARRIVVDPQIHFGQPILEGTRIPVWCVLELVQAGIPFAQIVERYYPDEKLLDLGNLAAVALLFGKALAPQEVPALAFDWRDSLCGVVRVRDNSGILGRGGVIV
jgi:uncharacterized protein (DUF433 family)